MDEIVDIKIIFFCHNFILLVKNRVNKIGDENYNNDESESDNGGSCEICRG